MNMLSVLDSLDMMERTFDTMVSNIPSSVKSFLPYDLYKDDNGKYTLELAVAGYSKDSLEVENKEGFIRIKGKASNKNDKVSFVHKGLSNRSFDFLFPFNSIYEIDNVLLKDGLLKITLFRNEEVIKKLEIKVA